MSVLLDLFNFLMVESDDVGAVPSVPFAKQVAYGDLFGTEGHGNSVGPRMCGCELTSR
jgi:hypothetical protein